MKGNYRRVYDFEGMEIGESRFFKCRKSDRDRLRNSLQASARNFGIKVSTKIDDQGITYKREA